MRSFETLFLLAEGRRNINRRCSVLNHLALPSDKAPVYSLPAHRQVPGLSFERVILHQPIFYLHKLYTHIRQVELYFLNPVLTRKTVVILPSSRVLGK